MLSRHLSRDQVGSGMAIGVAMIFPMLMLVIVALQFMTATSRAEQSLQATANRAARTASLCCYFTGGTEGAEDVVKTSLTAAQSSSAFNRVNCDNDLAGDSRTVFTAVAGVDVAIGPANAVPPGGTVHVILECRMSPESLGGIALPGFTVGRTVVGTATIDPYRFRAGA